MKGFYLEQLRVWHHTFVKGMCLKIIPMFTSNYALDEKKKLVITKRF